MTEQHVNVASKMYKARNSMKSMFGDTYPGKVKVWMMIVKSVSEGKKITVIEAAHLLIQDAVEKHPDDAGILSVWILAAAVELIEPSFTP